MANLSHTLEVIGAQPYVPGGPTRKISIYQAPAYLKWAIEAYSHQMPDRSKQTAAASALERGINEVWSYAGVREIVAAREAVMPHGQPRAMAFFDTFGALQIAMADCEPATLQYHIPVDLANRLGHLASQLGLTASRLELLALMAGLADLSGITRAHCQQAIVRSLRRFRTQLEGLRLNNGWYLRLLLTFRFEPSQSAGGQKKLKTLSSNYQYQRDGGNSSWLFRYEYSRVPLNHYAPGHIHLRAEPSVTGSLIGKQLLEEVHFPTGRVTLESIIRLLIDDFNVAPHQPEAVWRPLLHETEAAFLKVARQPTPQKDREPPQSAR